MVPPKAEQAGHNTAVCRQSCRLLAHSSSTPNTTSHRCRHGPHDPVLYARPFRCTAMPRWYIFTPPFTSIHGDKETPKVGRLMWLDRLDSRLIPIFDLAHCPAAPADLTPLLFGGERFIVSSRSNRFLISQVTVYRTIAKSRFGGWNR